MTGKRLLNQVLSWEFGDYRPNDWKTAQNSTTKRWSKKVRRFLKGELNDELLEYNTHERMAQKCEEIVWPT